MPQDIFCQVIHATPEQVFTETVCVPESASVRQAIIQSGLVAKIVGFDWDNLVVGVYGQKCPLTAKVNPGDRIEIYRPLVADPKLIRRRRAELAKS